MFCVVMLALNAEWLPTRASTEVSPADVLTSVLLAMLVPWQFMQVLA